MLTLGNNPHNSNTARFSRTFRSCAETREGTCLPVQISALEQISLSTWGTGQGLDRFGRTGQAGQVGDRSRAGSDGVSRWTCPAALRLAGRGVGRLRVPNGARGWERWRRTRWRGAWAPDGGSARGVVLAGWLSGRACGRVLELARPRSDRAGWRRHWRARRGGSLGRRPVGGGRASAGGLARGSAGSRRLGGCRTGRTGASWRESGAQRGLLVNSFTLWQPRGPMFNDELPPNGLDLKQELARLEDRLIGEALKRCNGNQTKAAVLLDANARLWP